MNPVVTSKEEIMDVCRNIVREKGLSSLNMRLVSQECNIALGTLYNYYSDKNALLIATVESVWIDIFHKKNGDNGIRSFPDYITHIFQCLQEGAVEYPGFFNAHSVAIVKSGQDRAKSMMEQYFRHMKQGMLMMLRSDPMVNLSVFTETFTEMDFIELLLNHILLLLMENKKDCSTLVELARRIIYR